MFFFLKIHDHIVKITVTAAIQATINPWPTPMLICTCVSHTLHLSRTHWTIQLLLLPLSSEHYYSLYLELKIV